MFKNKKYIYLFFSFYIIIVFFFLSANYVLADSAGASFGFLPSCSASDPKCLSTYLSTLFKVGVGFAGGIAIISFVVGAIMLIASGDSTGAASEAKDRMKGAILGLALTVCSWLLIDTINPKLEGVTLPKSEANTPTSVTPGVYYYLSGSDCSAAGKSGSSNSTGTSGTGTGSSNSSSSSGSGWTAVSEPSLSAPYLGKNLIITIVPDTTNNINFGVIIHQNPGLDHGGTCSDIITKANCLPVNVGAGAIEVFKISNNPKYSGNGVSFYSEDFGWDAGKAPYTGVIPVASGQIVSPFSKGAAGDYNFTWPSTAMPGRVKNCPTFKDCPGSMQINGSYLVALYSKNNYCETFLQSVPHMDAQPFVASGTQQIDTVYIVPLQ